MDIIIGRTPGIRKVSSNRSGYPFEAKKTVRKNRRKNEQDRRRSVREGIFVSFREGPERRVLRDRRKNSYHRGCQANIPEAIRI